MAKKFNLAELMGGVSNLDTSQAGEKNVSNLDTFAIREIPLDQIDANAQNFYVVENVSDLAESIQMVGLQQPLVVLPVDGRYRLIAGHRRYKALTELGKATAPCLIRTGLTDTEEQLALILTNSTARELTYPEKIEQAKRLKELYIKRREEGAKLPGRIRDMVADAMNESAAAIARMEATDRNLIDEWKKELNVGRLSASNAYEISKMDQKSQKRLKKEFGSSVLTAKIIKAAAETSEYSFAPLKCPLRPLSPCTGYAKRAKMVADSTCPGCCNQCDHPEGCPAICGLAKNKIICTSEQASRERETAEAEEKYMHSAYRKAQLSLMRWAKDKRFDDAETDSLYVVKFFRRMTDPFRDHWSPSLQDLFEFADLLGISLPELLGIEPELPPCTLEWHKYPVDAPNEGETVLCQYGKKRNFLLMVYREGEFGQIADKEFVSAPFDVHYWTRSYPEGE